jgi:cholesterol transport system auxiliary component
LGIGADGMRGMNVHPLIRAGLVCIGLSGCAVAGIGSNTPPATYNLTAPAMAGIQFPHWPIQLTILRPTAMNALDTNRIVVMAPGGRLSYFEEAAWSDRLTSLLQARIVEAMQDSKAFLAVLTMQDRIDGDYALAVEIRAFQVEVGKGQSTAMVTLFAKIVQERRGRVIATKEFSAQVPAGKDTPESGVVALQTGFEQAMKDMARWTASSVNGRSGA